MFPDAAVKRMSLSKIIRQAPAGPSVSIGEKHHDSLAEAAAERKLRAIFPVVSLVTTPEGARLIPISEVYRLEEKLRAECEQAGKVAYEKGYKDGLQEGLSEARTVLEQFEKAICELVNQRESVLTEARQHILELALKVAKKVTFDAVQVDSETTIRMIEGVIAQLVDRSELKVKVNPDHLPFVEQSLDRFLSESTAIKSLKFEPDARVTFGGCFIETPTGDIDARLESQFEVISQAFDADEEES